MGSRQVGQENVTVVRARADQGLDKDFKSKDSEQRDFGSTEVTGYWTRGPFLWSSSYGQVASSAVFIKRKHG